MVHALAHTHSHAPAHAHDTHKQSHTTHTHTFCFYQGPVLRAHTRHAHIVTHNAHTHTPSASLRSSAGHTHNTHTQSHTTHTHAHTPSASLRSSAEGTHTTRAHTPLLLLSGSSAEGGSLGYGAAPQGQKEQGLGAAITAYEYAPPQGSNRTTAPSGACAGGCQSSQGDSSRARGGNESGGWSRDNTQCGTGKGAAASAASSSCRPGGSLSRAASARQNGGVFHRWGGPRMCVSVCVCVAVSV